MYSVYHKMCLPVEISKMLKITEGDSSRTLRKFTNNAGYTDSLHGYVLETKKREENRCRQQI